MKNYLVAERYARSVAEATPDNAALQETSTALCSIADVYNESPEFRNFLDNPAITRQKRIEVVGRIAERENLPEIVSRLLQLLVKRGRTSLLPDVAEVLDDLTDERFNRTRATVTSAVELSEEEEASVRSALERLSGKKVRVDKKINPKILGGVVTQIGSTVIDASIRTKLNRMREALLEQ